MRKSKLVWNVVCLLLWTAAAFGQTDQRIDQLQNVIPPSPNASSLGKYADWPVNLYTGLPGIDIPIYELKGRKVSVPISLSYHASGIKVGENASGVGLGWSLQAGGVITRSVRGLADEDPGGLGYLNLRSYYNNPGDLSSGTMATGTSAYSDSALQFSVANGNADSEPDLYMISALGRSYKFFFSSNGIIVTQPYSNLKIIFNVSAESWLVTTEDGTKLLFGGGSGYEETTHSQLLNVLTDTYISSWYLQSITSPTGEVINFTYYASAPIELDGSYYQADFLLDHVDLGYISSGLASTSKSAQNRLNDMNVTQLTLASIESDLGRIVFDTTGRIDLPGSLAVTGIKVFSKLKNTYIKSYKLYYGYSAAVSGNAYSGGYTSIPYRLKLDSLEEIPIDNTPHKYWQFSYNPRNLPSRKSYAQDYWGYFNGATSNTNFLPYVEAFSPDKYVYANRSADSTSMQAEMLSRITYPTGGYSQFNFEPNGYPANEEQFTTVSLSPHLYMTYGQSNFSNTHTDTFTLTKNQYITYTFRGSFSTIYLNDFGTTTNLASAVLKNSSGTSVSSANLVKTDNNVTKSVTILLTPGTYTFTISSISQQSDFGSTSQTVDLSSSYSYAGSVGYKVVNHPVGGVRIKSIFYYDNVDTTKSIKKYYQYENPDVIAPVDPVNDFVTAITDATYDCGGTMTSCGIPGCWAYSVIYQCRSSSTKFALGSIQGGTIGYGKVTEKFGANAENGKNVYYYTDYGDGNVASAKGFPYPAIVSLDYQRGLLQEQDTYTAANALVSKIQNSYQYISRSGGIKTYKVAYKSNNLSGCYSHSADGYLSSLLYRIFYTDYSNQVQHTQSVQTSYNTATGDSLTMATNYYYDDTLNMQPVRTVALNSKGDTVLTYMRTALEKTAINSSISLTGTALAAIDSMVSRNMVGAPLQSERYTKGILTSKSLSNYKLQGSGLVLPDNVVVQNASNAAETRILFPRYDANGNLLEQMKYRDSRRDYIWDYKNTYPVAEVTGGDSMSAYTSFEADGSGGWTIGSPARDSTTRTITGYNSYTLGSGSITKSGLTSTSTYILSYWSKNGSYTVSGSSSLLTGKSVTLGITIWTYYEHTVTGVTSLAVSGTGNIDELRLYLTGAQMTSYTYDPLIGVTSGCDVGNRVTYYQYDGYGRLYTVKDQDGNTLKKYCYSYNGQANACTQYYNVAKSGTYIRNNCASGGTPSSVTYTVPTGAYYSMISQADADAKAQSDVTANGQTYANANGTCTFYNTVKSGTFTRNNCATGGTGSTVTYTVAANTYSSLISQGAADTLAINAVAAGGQSYANTNGTCTFYNTVKSGTFTRNNCATGGTGSTVTYTVAANTYSSLISQGAADTLAINAVAAGGQSYANTNGTCTFYNTAKSGNYTRNNCATGGTGSTVTYTVAANTYSSLISQGAADTLAINAVAAGGQSYANTNGTCTFSNVAKSGTYTRNNCGTGYVGSSVTYTVAAGTHTSLVSQATADSLAQAAVTANGQTYANTNGVCIPTYTITATNYIGLSGFYVTFTNTATSAVTTFSIPAAGGTLGTLPGGTYNVYMAKTGNTSTNYTYSVCTISSASVVSRTFSNMTISSSCNTVTVDGQ